MAAEAAEQLQQNGDAAPEEGEGEGGEEQQRLLTPHYRINTSQDYEGGPQMMELLVDMPGAKVQRRSFLHHPLSPSSSASFPLPSSPLPSPPYTLLSPPPLPSHPSHLPCLSPFNVTHLPSLLTFSLSSSLTPASFPPLPPAFSPLASLVSLPPSLCNLLLIDESVSDAPAALASSLPTQSHELDVFTEQLPLDSPLLPGPPDLGAETENGGGAATQVVVTVLAEGKYELRVPLGSDVEPMLHPAKFNKKSGRLRVFLVTAPEQQEQPEAHQQPRPMLTRRAASNGAGQEEAGSEEEEEGGAGVQESSEAVGARVASLGFRP